MRAKITAVVLAWHSFMIEEMYTTAEFFTHLICLQEIWLCDLTKYVQDGSDILMQVK